jgi:serine phosphatase RsbU (regulator of sigma subunit)
MPMPDPNFRAIFRFFCSFLPRILSAEIYYTVCNKQKMVLQFMIVLTNSGSIDDILGISLNEIMQSGISLNANRILNMMREKVMKALHQTGYGSKTKDSIDIGLCVVDCFSGKMQYSGANRPLIMLREGELTEFKPDKMTIGVAPLKEIPFTNVQIDTKPGDVFYLFSDGFSDQFGAITDKKFKHTQFKKLIESFKDLPMAQQKEYFEKVFMDWKGDTQQVDDVLVFGFQF